MKVTYVESDTGVEFRDLSNGEVFTEKNDTSSIYIKIEEVFNEFDTFNAVCLFTGIPLCFQHNQKIYPLDAELRVSEY